MVKMQICSWRLIPKVLPWALLVMTFGETFTQANTYKTIKCLSNSAELSSL